MVVVQAVLAEFKAFIAQVEGASFALGAVIESALVNPGVTFGATSFARRRSTSSFLIRSLLAVRREFGSREGVEVVRLVAGACGSRLVTSEAESAFLLGCATFEAVWSSCM